MEGLFSVYKHTFPNGKVYIGITSQNVHRRWRDGSGYKGQFVYNAIVKYGWDNINHEVLLSGLSQAEAEKAEIHFVEAFRSDSRKYGYNVQHGGDVRCGFTMREESCKKMSASRSGEKNWLYGKHLSEETKRKLSEAHKGKSIDREAIMRGAEKRRLNPYNAQAVRCVETGIVYISCADAARKCELSQQKIWQVCKGMKKSTGGLHWEYADRKCKAN